MLGAMADLFISDDEYAAIERLLADLVDTAVDADEEAKILAIHARLTAIHAQGAALRASKDRLRKINAGENA